MHPTEFTQVCFEDSRKVAKTWQMATVYVTAPHLLTYLLLFTYLLTLVLLTTLSNYLKKTTDASVLLYYVIQVSAY